MSDCLSAMTRMFQDKIDLANLKIGTEVKANLTFNPKRLTWHANKMKLRPMLAKDSAPPSPPPAEPPAQGIIGLSVHSKDFLCLCSY